MSAIPTSPITQLVMQTLGTEDIAGVEHRLLEMFSSRHPREKSERMAKSLLQPRMVPVYVMVELEETLGLSEPIISAAREKQVEFLKEYYPDNLQKRQPRNRTTQMSPGIEKEFYAEFPELFRGRFKPREESAMALGLDCSDEFQLLLWWHCQALEQAAVDEGFVRTDAQWPEILQVKVKVGTLRVYVAHETARMRALREQLLVDSARGDMSLL